MNDQRYKRLLRVVFSHDIVEAINKNRHCSITQLVNSTFPGTNLTEPELSEFLSLAKAAARRRRPWVRD